MDVALCQNDNAPFYVSRMTHWNGLWRNTERTTGNLFQITSLIDPTSSASIGGTKYSTPSWSRVHGPRRWVLWGMETWPLSN